jgi:hypothetical protein
MFSPSNDALSGLAGGTGIGAVPGSNSLKPMQIKDVIVDLAASIAGLAS